MYMWNIRLEYYLVFLSPFSFSANCVYFLELFFSTWPRQAQCTFLQLAAPLLPSSSSSSSFFFFSCCCCCCFYFFFSSDRERAKLLCVNCSAGWGGRGRERILSGFHTQYEAGCRAQSHDPEITWAEIKSLLFNQPEEKRRSFPPSILKFLKKSFWMVEDGSVYQNKLRKNFGKA